MAENKTKRNKRLEGIVVSNKMAKTVVVLVERLKLSSKYKKYHKISKRFKAHDEKGEYRLGDRVMIEETRPMSRDKRWRVIKLLGKSQQKEVVKPEEVSGEASAEVNA